MKCIGQFIFPPVWEIRRSRDLGARGKNNDVQGRIQASGRPAMARAMAWVAPWYGLLCWLPPSHPSIECDRILSTLPWVCILQLACVGRGQRVRMNYLEMSAHDIIPALIVVCTNNGKA